MTLRLPFALSAVWAALALASGGAHAASGEADDVSLEELLKTEVVTVSRKPQSLQSTAAAAFVITREDIDRSGATTVPEALRMAPGVDVARIAGDRWAVSVRGFNGRYANKLLVLVDGRSIYSPLFSGVIWEFEATLLEDVDRIEVIRGPGASLWGANAVNGVINIITRKARDTQGELAALGGGTSDRVFGAFRHGGEADGGHYRVWAKTDAQGESPNFAGQGGQDNWRAVRTGFRRDWSLASGDRLMLSGEAFDSHSGDLWYRADVTAPQGFVPTAVAQTGQGGNLLARREWRLADGSDAALQAYVDHSDINVRNELRQKRTTFDLDFQRRAVLFERHDLIWGVGYRFSHDSIDAQDIFRVAQPQRNLSLASAFLQDEYALVPERLNVVAGMRLEYHSYTGFEPQPNLRMVWTPTADVSAWTALSHAVRTPSRAERDMQVDLVVQPANPPGQPLPVLLRNSPSDDAALGSEHVNTFELGFRQQLGPNLSADMTAFYSRYDHLSAGSLGQPQVVLAAQPYVLQPFLPGNASQARAAGIEVAIDWHPLPWWRLQSSYARERLTGSANGGDAFTQQQATSVGDTLPRDTLSLRSSFTIDARRQLDVWLRAVSALAAVDNQGNRIAGYATLDLRYAWRPVRRLELSIVGQNLLQRRHAEFVPDLLPSQTLLVERSLYAKLKYLF